MDERLKVLTDEDKRDLPIAALNLPGRTKAFLFDRGCRHVADICDRDPIEMRRLMTSGKHGLDMIHTALREIDAPGAYRSTWPDVDRWFVPYSQVVPFRDRLRPPSLYYRNAPAVLWPIVSTSDKIGGWVYFIRFERFIKIGLARDLIQRFSNIQTCHPRPLSLWLAIPFQSYREASNTERTLHLEFRDCWASGEWFRAESRLVRLVIASRREVRNRRLAVAA